MNARADVPAASALAPLADVFRSNRGWEVDAMVRLRTSESRAWKVAAAGMAIGVLGVLAAAAGGALRQHVPVPIVVDKTTGETTITQRLDDETVPALEVVDRHNAARYVRSREQYYWQFVNDDLRQVARTTTSSAFADYQRRYAKGDSLADQLKRSAEWRIHVINVRFTAASRFGRAGEAVVTYDKDVYSLDKDLVESRTRHVATFLYEYHPRVRLSEADRLENPLGFLVTAYRTSAELSAN